MYKESKPYILIILLAGLFAVTQNPRHEEQIIQVAAKTLPKAVMIRSVVEEPTLIVTMGDQELFRSTETVVRTYLGSGVFITPTGHVLTCAHLFHGVSVLSITVKTIDQYEQPAELIYKDAALDLALLKIEVGTSPVSYARIADSKKLRVGQEAIAIGNPLSLEWTVTHGIISYLNRQFDDRVVNQTDTFINPGNSGGPLFNLRGELIGINSFMISPVRAAVFTGLGFCVSPRNMEEFLARFKGLEKVRK